MGGQGYPQMDYAAQPAPMYTPDGQPIYMDAMAYASAAAG